MWAEETQRTCRARKALGGVGKCLGCGCSPSERESRPSTSRQTPVTAVSYSSTHSISCGVDMQAEAIFGESDPFTAVTAVPT